MSAASAPVRKVASKVSTTIGVAPPRATVSKTHLTVLPAPPEEKPQTAASQVAVSPTPSGDTLTGAATNARVEPEFVLEAIVPRAPRTAAITLLIASVLGAAALVLEDVQRHAHHVEAHTRMHAVLRRPTMTAPSVPPTPPVIAAPIRRVARPAPRLSTGRPQRVQAHAAVTHTLAQVATATSAGPHRSPVCPVR